MIAMGMAGCPSAGSRGNTVAFSVNHEAISWCQISKQTAFLGCMALSTEITQHAGSFPVQALDCLSILHSLRRGCV